MIVSASHLDFFAGRRTIIFFFPFGTAFCFGEARRAMYAAVGESAATMLPSSAAGEEGVGEATLGSESEESGEESITALSA